MSAKFWQKRLKNPAIPRKRIKGLRSVGGGNKAIAATLAIFGLTVPLPTSWPRYNTCGFPKLDLPRLMPNPAALTCIKRLRMCSRCSCQLSAHVATSSTYASVFSIFPVTLLIKRWKIAPEFRIRNRAPLYCHKPRGVQKAETSCARSVNGSCQYPFKQSKTLIYFALPILSILSNKRGIGKLSGLVTEFTLLKLAKNKFDVQKPLQT